MPKTSKNKTITTIPYHGGLYHGSTKAVKKKQGKKHTIIKVIPHGAGCLTFNDIHYDGGFRNGFEDGKGKLTWPDGTTFIGSFKEGRPHPKVFHLVRALKDKVKNFEASDALQQFDLEECKEDLALEKDRVMDVALALDRCQSRLEHSEKKLHRLYEFARSEGMNVDMLNEIRFS